MRSPQNVTVIGRPDPARTAQHLIGYVRRNPEAKLVVEAMRQARESRQAEAKEVYAMTARACMLGLAIITWTSLVAAAAR